METITNVRTSVKKDKVLAVIRTEGSETPIFLTDKQIASATGLKSNYSILKGSKIDVEYYNEGEELVDGNKCTAGGKLVKEFEFELSDQLNKLAGAGAFGVALFAQ